MKATTKGERGHVLIVDDDQAIREILAELLADEGYAVVVATNGAEALATLGDGRRFCVVLLDLMMPVMDGWEFRRRQLQDASLARTPVIVFSGADNVSRQADVLCAQDFLEKPVDVDRLLACVGRYCAG